MHESSGFSTHSPAFDVSILDFSYSNRCVDRCLTVLIWNYLMTSDVEHLFKYLCICICTSSLVRCLSRSFAQFLIRLFVYLLNFRSALYILQIFFFFFALTWLE